MGGNILALSRPEKEVYLEHKKFIKEHAKTWVEVWARVVEIREKKWYLAEYVSFKAFCQDVLGLSDRMVRYYMQGVKDAETLLLNGNSRGTNVPLPSEGALRKARHARHKQLEAEVTVIQAEAGSAVIELKDPYAGLSRKELVKRIHKGSIELKFADAENKIGQMKRLVAQIMALAANLQRNMSKSTEIVV
jgi:hypothetical protein